MSFKPLKHGERFTYVAGSRSAVGRYRMRDDGVKMDPEIAIRENFVYAKVFCTEDTEGVLWVRGWNTKAANALRVACAL